MKWDAGMTRSSKHASLLAHEEAFAANLPAKKKYLADKVRPAGVDRAAVARLLSVFDDDDDDHDKSSGSCKSSPRAQEKEEAAIIGGMVLDAVSLSTAAAARTVSDDAADGVLPEGLQGGPGAAPGTSCGHGVGDSGGAMAVGSAGADVGGVGGNAHAARADSAGCFDLGVLIQEALERYRHEKDERLLRQRLAEWVSVSRASSLTAASPAEVEQACQAALAAVGVEAARASRDGGVNDDDGSVDSFVMV